MPVVDSVSKQWHILLHTQEPEMQKSCRGGGSHSNGGHQSKYFNANISNLTISHIQCRFSTPPTSSTTVCGGSLCMEMTGVWASLFKLRGNRRGCAEERWTDDMDEKTSLFTVSEVRWSRRDLKEADSWMKGGRPVSLMTCIYVWSYWLWNGTNGQEVGHSVSSAGWRWTGARVSVDTAGARPSMFSERLVVPIVCKSVCVCARKINQSVGDDEQFL